MTVIRLVAVNVFKECVRDKVLYNLVVFAVMMIATSYLLGVSTRRMEKLAETLGITRLSKSQVSVMAKDLDEQVQLYLKRTPGGTRISATEVAYDNGAFVVENFRDDAAHVGIGRKDSAETESVTIPPHSFRFFKP